MYRYRSNALWLPFQNVEIFLAPGRLEARDDSNDLLAQKHVGAFLPLLLGSCVCLNHLAVAASRRSSRGARSYLASGLANYFRVADDPDVTDAHSRFGASRSAGRRPASGVAQKPVLRATRPNGTRRQRRQNDLNEVSCNQLRQGVQQILNYQGIGDNLSRINKLN
jgi:hypothetical protein